MRQLSFEDRLNPRRSPARGKKRAAKTLDKRWLRLRRPIPTLTAAATLLALAGTGAYWLVHPDQPEKLVSDVRAGIASLGASLGLTVENVYSRGHRELGRDTILAALSVERGDPILSFDPDLARARLEAVGWVKSASVRRRLPDTIDVHIVERLPFALWQREGEMVLIDRDGTAIGQEAVDQHVYLPLIVGDGAPLAAPELFDIMAEHPALLNRVKAAVRVGNRRWDLRFDSGLTAQLPERDLVRAWDRLVELIFTRRLLDSAIAVVDLRLEDRTVLRRAPDGAEAGLDDWETT